jgi:hypothetical protein
MSWIIFVTKYLINSTHLISAATYQFHLLDFTLISMVPSEMQNPVFSIQIDGNL